VVRATSAGRKAQEVWRPLFGFVEKRWEARLGKPQLDQLRASLWALVSQLDVDLPDCLPILGYGLFSKVHRQEPGLRPVANVTTGSICPCYKQIGSSVGELGTDTLQAATAAIESTSPGDSTYVSTDAALSELEYARDDIAGQIKNALFAAKIHDRTIPPATVQAQIGLCNALLASAAELAAWRRRRPRRRRGP
jgi:hypothetical protein